MTEKILTLAVENVALDIPFVGSWLWPEFEALTEAHQLLEAIKIILAVFNSVFHDTRSCI